VDEQPAAVAVATRPVRTVTLARPKSFLNAGVGIISKGPRGYSLLKKK
jgi:hypothetical protein